MNAPKSVGQETLEAITSAAHISKPSCLYSGTFGAVIIGSRAGESGLLSLSGYGTFTASRGLMLLIITALERSMSRRPSEYH